MTNHIQLIEAEAQRLGFCLFGVSAADRESQSYQYYLEWINKGYHAEMAYLSTDRALYFRQNTSRIMEGAKTVISLGVKYPKNSVSMNQTTHGKIAAYACGEDYHLSLVKSLNELVRFIETVSGREVSARVYTDTGPLLERELAFQSGLGWIGKNSCLISQKYGSYLLLCEIITDLVLERETDVSQNHCGRCTRCIQACPTNCILPNNTIDASRCISYQTIENKGIIPIEIREAVGTRIFGCDICQEVCPWNAGGRISAGLEHSMFKTQPELMVVDIYDELQLIPEKFTLKYKNTPIKRAKYQGFMRNLIIAAGNTKDPINVPRLCDLLSNAAYPMLQYHAAWSFGRIHNHQAINTLSAMLKQTVDPLLRFEIESAL